MVTLAKSDLAPFHFVSVVIQGMILITLKGPNDIVQVNFLYRVLSTRQNFG